MGGQGSFGSVYKVLHKQSGEICAMKVIQKVDFDEDVDPAKIATAERRVLTLAPHPYIVPLRFAFETRKQFVLVMKFCPWGNLQRFVNEHGQLSVHLARHFAAELLLALTHLHNRKVWHRDVKPANVILDEEGHALLADFGTCKEDGLAASGFVGSIPYMAPEVLLRRSHNHTVDIYGLGAVVYTMLTNQLPFGTNKKADLVRSMRECSLIVPQHVEPTAAAFVESLTCREPSERLGADQTDRIKDHAFFTGIDFKALYRREISVPAGVPAVLPECKVRA